MVVMKTGRCQLCKRPDLALTRHHLIPRMTHKRARRSDPESNINEIAMICRPCHSHIHTLMTEKEMHRTYNTIEKLAAHEGVQKFVKWLQGKRVGAVLYN